MAAKTAEGNSGFAQMILFGKLTEKPHSYLTVKISNTLIGKPDM